MKSDGVIMIDRLQSKEKFRECVKSCRTIEYINIVKKKRKDGKPKKKNYDDVVNNIDKKEHSNIK